MEEKNKKSKKIVIVILVILICLLAAAGAVMYFVGLDNIKAAYYGFKYDDDEISNMLEDNTQKLKDKVAEYSYIVTREPTKEEIEAVESGEIDDEQLSSIIANGVTLEDFRANNYEIIPPEPKPEEPSAEEKSAADAECDRKVSQIVSKMYILRSSFTGSLSSLLSQAYAEVKAGGSKGEVASRYMGMGQTLEAQCDGNVAALMSELTAILTANGRSTELVDSIYATYNSEKQYTKAYYMNLYLK